MAKSVPLPFPLLYLVLALVLQPLAGRAQTGYINAQEFAQSQQIKDIWYPIQKTMVLRKGSTVVHLRVDSITAHVNNQPITLPSPPRLVDGNLMVPARTLVQLFSAGTPTPPPAAPPGIVPQPEPPRIMTQPDPPRDAVQPAPPQVLPSDTDQETKLVTVRHSMREDHTRVVLEFDGIVGHQVQQSDPTTVKLLVSGCRNLIPTSRSNPAGRDLANVSFNSGPNRQGLVITFTLKPGAKPPTVETVANPFRMILSFYGPGEPKPTVASASGIASIAPGIPPIAALPPKAVVATTTSKPGDDLAPILDVPPKKVEPTPPPDIRIEVPPAVLTRETFKGRAIIIDPGHGGSDLGIQVPGLPSEKEITLGIATTLASVLKELGFSAFLLRKDDTELSILSRRALANRYGGDLLISLHCGATRDDHVEGIACFTYDKSGQAETDQSSHKISGNQVFKDWLNTTRFDLATYLGDKLRDRLTKHLGVPSRGLRSLPLYPLRFLIYPAVLVEVGVLTNPEEGKRLASPGYREAVARSLANGVVDFFNGIRLQE